MPLLASLLSPMDMAIIGILAVLLFGDRLPQVMRALGQGLTEFKKGMREIEDQIENAARQPSPPPPRIDQLGEHSEPTATHFEPPAAEQAEAKPGEPSSA